MNLNTRYYSPREAPFQIYGLYNPCTEDSYKRIPDDVAHATSEMVEMFYKCTTGGRVRFATNSSYVIIRARTNQKKSNFHCTPLMESGFDLYIDGQNGSRYAGPFMFDTDQYREYESRIELPEGTKELTINMPLFGTVLDLEIGLDSMALVWEHSPYRNEKPIVFYGSSITHGAVASRPGLCYENRISRRFNCDFTNLGFSGGAKGEETIATYMSTLSMCAFVSDYDANAPDAEHLRNTHYRLYEIIREKHPDIPYFMVTRPAFYFGNARPEHRDIIMTHYLKACDAGDRNVYFIDGSTFFVADDGNDCTTDLSHPNDIGFYRMAEKIGHVIGHVMNWLS